MFGDDLIVEDAPGQYLSHLISTFEKYQPAVILGAQKVPPSEVARYGSIKYVKDRKYPHRAVQVLEKIPAAKAPSSVVQFGRFVYSPKIFAVLANLPTSSKSGRIEELWLADANNILAKTEIALAEPIKNGTWMTTGDPSRWLKANLAVALKSKETKKEIVDFIKKLDLK